jgi:hypothetical protein
MVNGERKGTTPLVLRDLSLGSYDVRLTRSGYAPVEQQVTLTAGEPSGSLVLTLANLEPSRAQAASDNRSAFGSLAALSRPSGATVYLDGRAIGSTPVVVAEVGAGSHEVRIERAGHRRWVTTVEVKAGERTRVAASLERGGME